MHCSVFSMTGQFSDRPKEAFCLCNELKEKNNEKECFNHVVGSPYVSGMLVEREKRSCRTHE